MKRSTDRILTTHVGSLSRPDDLVTVLTAKDRGQPYDREAYTRLVRDAVADVVRPEYYAWSDRIAEGLGGRAAGPTARGDVPASHRPVVHLRHAGSHSRLP